MVGNPQITFFGFGDGVSVNGIIKELIDDNNTTFLDIYFNSSNIDYEYIADYIHNNEELLNKILDDDSINDDFKICFFYTLINHDSSYFNIISNKVKKIDNYCVDFMCKCEYINQQKYKNIYRDILEEKCSDDGYLKLTQFLKIEKFNG